MQQVRVSVTGRVDALRLARNYGRCVPDREERPLLMRAKHQLLPAWLDYVANISASDWAVSLESAAYTLWLARRLKPSHLLDTGSGFSSYVLRRYQREQTDGVVVVSVDSSPEWLEVTRSFLANHELPTDRLMTWTDFQELEPKDFDFVFHDLGPRELRVSAMHDLLHDSRPEASVIIDDGQFPEIAHAARAAARLANRPLYSLRRVTRDEVGRFALLAGPVRR